MAQLDRNPEKLERPAGREAGYAISAHYDRRNARVVVELNTGVQLSFPPNLVEELAGSSADSLSEIEISPAGLGLHWPQLDADVYVLALLQGIFGTKSWMARLLGAKGGQVRSDAKASASRKNGQKGGRPRRSTVA